MPHRKIVTASILTWHRAWKAVGRSEDEAFDFLQRGFDDWCDKAGKKRQKLMRSICKFETLEVGQVLMQPVADPTVTYIVHTEDEESLKGQEVRCAACEKVFNAGDEPFDVIGDHWICCASNYGTHELADKLDVPYEDVCEALGTEP